MLAYRTIQNEKLLIPYHLSVYHVSEGVPTKEERDQVSYVLSEEVENDGVYGPIEGAPYFRKRVSQSYEYTVRRHHHHTPDNVDQKEDKN